MSLVLWGLSPTHDASEIISCSVKWIQGDGMGMSIYELAFRFWQESKLVPPEVTSKSGDSFMLLVLWVRHFIREAKKVKAVLFPPSVVYEPRKVWYASHTFPYGRFLNGRIFASNSHLQMAARKLLYPDRTKDGTGASQTRSFEVKPRCSFL